MSDVGEVFSVVSEDDCEEEEVSFVLCEEDCEDASFVLCEEDCEEASDESLLRIRCIAVRSERICAFVSSCSCVMLRDEPVSFFTRYS